MAQGVTTGNSGASLASEGLHSLKNTPRTSVKPAIRKRSGFKKKVRTWCQASLTIIEWTCLKSLVVRACCLTTCISIISTSCSSRSSRAKRPPCYRNALILPICTTLLLSTTKKQHRCNNQWWWGPMPNVALVDHLRSSGTLISRCLWHVLRMRKSITTRKLWKTVCQSSLPIISIHLCVKSRQIQICTAPKAKMT